LRILLKNSRFPQDESPKNNPISSPVVLVPGDGGSQLEARLSKSYKYHHVCKSTSDWYQIWLNIHLLMPIAFDCLSDNLRLHYDQQTRRTRNTEGVEIRARDFGSLLSVDYLDAMRLPQLNYFEGLIENMESNNGLKRDVDMVAAPYDFRKAPNELDDFFANFTKLIEEEYIRSNYKPVTLVCHSMGCLNSIHLLNQKSNDWKQVYIRRLIALAAPFGGSTKSIYAMLFGDNFNIPLLNKFKLRELQSTFPSLMYLFPREVSFSINKTFVQTPSVNYTLKNLDQLFLNMNLSDQYQMWLDTRKLASSLRAPDVELWCLYGTGINTIESIIYHDDPSTRLRNSSEDRHYVLWGDGDGAVNVESLRYCEEFRLHQSKPVWIREFPQLDHRSILRDPDALNFITNHIMTQE